MRAWASACTTAAGSKRSALCSREPALGEGFHGALHCFDPKAVSNPGALTKGYARLFQSGGGSLLVGDATTLHAENDAWTVQTSAGRISAKDVVVALGPWSDTVFAPLGYRIALRAKRGYHMHYAPARGPLRLTTGVEIAKRNAAPTGVQIERAERLAKPLFGLGERLDPQPWLGMRPCTPDMRPLIGQAPRHRGLWFAFGHNPPRADARPRHRPPACRDDDGRHAFHRRAAVPAIAVRLSAN
ncbi:glycine/D-amino acid oxidase-like deaminating enzyme [Paraburkholderia youngii]